MRESKLTLFLFSAMRKRKLLAKLAKIVRSKDGKANEEIISLTPSDVKLINEGIYLNLLDSYLSYKPLQGTRFCFAWPSIGCKSILSFKLEPTIHIHKTLESFVSFGAYIFTKFHFNRSINLCS